MTSPSPFKMISLNHDGDTLYVGWLPDGKLLVGIDADYQEGRAICLEYEEAMDLALNLFSKESIHFENLQLSVTKANRGDPYRDGMEVSIGTWENGECNFFVEDRRLKEISGVINPALKVPQESPSYG